MYSYNQNIFHHHIPDMYSRFIKFTVKSTDPLAKNLPLRENATIYTQAIIYIYIYIYIYQNMIRDLNK